VNHASLIYPKNQRSIVKFDYKTRRLLPVIKKTYRPYRRISAIRDARGELIEDLIKDLPDRDEARFRSILRKAPMAKRTPPKRNMVTGNLCEPPGTALTQKADFVIIKSISEGLKTTRQSMEKLEGNVSQRNRLVDTLSQSAERA
jgi:hypothetical protein